MNNGKCFIYCRQSSGQEDSENSLSIQQQIQNCEEYAKKKGIPVSGIFTDANVSGKTYPAGARFEKIAENDREFQKWYEQQASGKKYRAGLGAMLARLSEVEYILLDEITRLHRSTGRSFLEQTIGYEIAYAKVKILQVKGEVLDLSKFDQNLIQMLRTQINDEQIANQKRKSMESRRRLKNDGVYTDVKFYGGVYEGNKRFHYEPEKAEVIQFIYRSLLNGISNSQLCCELNTKYRDRSIGKNGFFETTLRSIATQPVYAGYMRNSEGELIPCKNAPSPIIELADFLAVQKILTERRNRGIKRRNEGKKRHNLPFSGILKCGVCGSRLTVTVDRGKIVYRCHTGTVSGNPHCKHIHLLVLNENRKSDCDLMQAAMPLLLFGFLSGQETLQARMHLKSNAETEETEIKRLRGKIKTAFDLFWNDVLDEESYKDSVASKMEELKVRQNLLLESRHVNHSEDVIALEDLQKNMKLFLKKKEICNADKFEHILHQGIKEIVVFYDRLQIITYAGMFELPRYRRDNRQKNVLPPASFEEINSGSSDDPRFRITYNYRKKNSVKTAIITPIRQIGPVQICRKD